MLWVRATRLRLRDARFDPRMLGDDERRQASCRWADLNDFGEDQSDIECLFN